MGTKSLISNVDLIRRFVFENKPVTLEQISEEIVRQMDSVSDAEKARDRYVLPVLKVQPYYRQTADGAWDIVMEEMPEYKVLHEVMQEEHRLMYEREVRSKVAQKLGFKVSTIVLDLEIAPGLTKHRSHWGLESWVIVNDQAAEVLAQHPGGLNEKDLMKHICERHSLTPEEAVLHLKSDRQKRFVMDRKLWYLKEDFEKLKQPAQDASLKLPDLKSGALDSSLEISFLEAQTAKVFDDEDDAHRSPSKSRLKKVLKKQAQDIIEQREDQKKEDLAAQLSKVLTAAGIDEYGVTSYQSVEPANKERGLSNKERDEIQAFLDQLLEQDTIGVGAPLAAVVNAPLSTKKVTDILRLKYINYTRDRAIIPSEYQRMMIELMQPRINESILHPACFDGQMAVDLLEYLFDGLAGAAWALVDEDSNIEIVQTNNARYRLMSRDAALLEQARDKFIVTQLDLINHYLNYNYTGIEADKVLAKAARVLTRLAGFVNSYIVSRDFFSELPEIFGMPPNDENSIPQRFDCIVGNFTFVQDPNVAASYLDQSLGLLREGGRLGVFVLQELLTLLKEHSLLGDFFKNMNITHFIRLPVLEGRHKVVLLIVKSPEESDQPAPPIITTEVADFKSANTLSHALVAGEDDEDLVERIEPMALATLIGD